MDNALHRTENCRQFRIVLVYYILHPIASGSTDSCADSIKTMIYFNILSKRRRSAREKVSLGTEDAAVRGTSYR